MSDDNGLKDFTDIELMAEFYKIMVKWNLFIMASEVLNDVEYMNVSRYLLIRQQCIKDEVQSRISEVYDDRWDYLLEIINADLNSFDEDEGMD